MRRLVLLSVLAPLTLVACDGVEAPTAVQPEADLAAQASAQAAGADLQDYIVVFKSGVANPAGLAAALVNQHGGALGYTYEHTIKGFSASLPLQAVEALQGNPNVDYVELDGVATLVTTTVPSNSWGLDRVDQAGLPLNGQYSYDYDGSGVYAYILDTGIRLSHNEFGDRASYGWDFIDNDPDAADCHSHGTHVAGTVGGTLYGVAKNVNLVALRVLNCQGSGSYSGITAAVDWVANDAVTKGLKAVANMSIGGGVSNSLNSAINAAVDAGVVFAVSAGNESTDACTRSPASAVNALTVGSTTSSDSRSSFSNFGTCVDIFAPGSSILSAIHTGDAATGTKSGTSMSSPHVAGAAALFREQYPSANAHTTNEGITAGATPGVVVNPGTGSPNLLLHTFFSGTPPTPPADIDVEVSHSVTTTGNKRKKGVATIRVEKAGPPTGDGVGGVTVSGTWYRDYGGLAGVEASGTTDASGNLVLQTPNIRDANDFEFCVNGLSGPGINNQTGLEMCADVGVAPPPPPPPPSSGPPSNLSVQYKTNGRDRATLRWTTGAATMVDIYRATLLHATNQANDGDWSEFIDGTNEYQVCEAGANPVEHAAQCTNKAG